MIPIRLSRGLSFEARGPFFRVMSREYKTVEAAKRSRFLCPTKTSPNLSVFLRP
jgi:hypothetical protein